MKALVPIAALLSLAALSGCGMMDMDTDRSLAQGQDLRIWGDPVTIYPGAVVQRSQTTTTIR